ncbi:putative integral membrane protein duf125 [Erysiphe neolycopersici]|uniref:Putative integral membrane protein duf125 n=1 Tax=Erysiphe neolycopersici TaxID=212602 RepID=A0A420HG65_9PEZI|nr:putative integral membrane protein duf125 [Erysiphe neolycopersici]
MDNKPAGVIIARRSNLLCSNGGIELMPELCLRVTELLIDSDPKAIRCLLFVCKSLSALVRLHEKSVTKNVSKNYRNFMYVNGSEKVILSFQSELKNGELERYTFPWVSEMKFRNAIVRFLINHEITEMAGKIDGWPSLNICRKELQIKLDWFKTRALFLLYRLADCVAGLYTTKTVRNQQSRFLHSLSTKELAFIGVIVEVMGHNFFIITKRSVVKSSPFQSSLQDSIQLHSVTNVQARPISELNDNWIRETMCVFEDLIQRYGPYFAWAFLEVPKCGQNIPSQWARCKIREGLANMNAFELGYTMSYASLQSVVWRAFRQKQGCSSTNSWNIAKELVEKEMVECSNDEL